MRAACVAFAVGLTGAGVLPAQADTAFVHEAQQFGFGEPYGRPASEFGRAVALSGDTLVVGVPLDDRYTDENVGAVYVFERSGTDWVETQRIVASDGTSQDRFGAAVALAGDTLLVGAPGEIDVWPNQAAGAVYAFTRARGRWTERQKLLPPVPAYGGYFGQALALSGDTAVVGEPHSLPPSPGPGVAHVFVRAGGTWSRQQTLTVPEILEGDGFGAAVAVAGDTAVVGAPQHDAAGLAQSGAAYVFVRSGTTWSQQQELVPAGAAPFDGFGWSVAAAGDAAIVGAPGAAAGGASGAGALYVFERSGTSWSQQQELFAAGAAHGDFLGVAVALDGDTLVAGAQDSGIAGAAHVFVRSGPAWSEQQKLQAAGGALDDRFGASVAVAGETVVASAPLRDSPARPDAGAATVFVRSGTTWTPQRELLAADGPAVDILGYSVALSGDTLVAGAVGDGGPEALRVGSAYVFTRAGGSWAVQQKLRASDEGADDQLGWSVAVSGDTAVVGARGDTYGGSGPPSAAYVFVRSGGVWTEQQKLVSPTATQNDGFGLAVAVSGDTIVVGGGGPPGLNSGAAYVFVRSGGVWTLQQTLVTADAETGDGFGAAVAIDGQTIVVGAPADTTPAGVQAGSACVFVRSGTAWSQQQQLFPPDGAVVHHFGAAVSLSGDTVIAGAPSAMSGGTNAGAAYVFTRAGTSWSLQQKLAAPEPFAFAEFARAVSVSGDAAIVSDHRSGGGERGLARVFRRAGTTWTLQPSALAAPDGVAGDVFGFSVAISGDTAAAGAPNDATDGEPLAGSVHLFRVAAGSDLAVTKTDGQTSAVPGETLAYTLTVSNSGPRAAAGATVTDLLPPALAGASWTCVASAGSACTASGTGDVTDTVSLPVDGTVTYTVTGTVASGATGVLSNTATVAPPAGVTDPDPSDNSATDVDTLTPTADLAVTAAASANAVSPGDTLVYTVGVVNAGPSVASSVQLEDALPPGVSFVSSTPGAPTCTAASGLLTCALGTLGAGTETAVSVTVTVNPSAGGVLANTATVRSGAADPQSSNDVSSIATVVRGAAGELVHGAAFVRGLSAAAGPRTPQDVFLIAQAPRASYEVVVDGASGDVGAGDGPRLERLGPDGTVLQSADAVGTGAARSLRFRNTAPSAVLDQTIRVRSAGCGSDCGPDDLYRIRAYETTAYVPRFNNGGTQVTVLVLQNSGAASVSGDVSFHAPSGALAGTHAFQLEPKAVLVLNTANVPGLAGLSGSIVVAHDGPYGVLTGKAVAVEPSTGLSFDSPLSSRPR